MRNKKLRVGNKSFLQVVGCHSTFLKVLDYSKSVKLTVSTCCNEPELSFGQAQAEKPNVLGVAL